jgi:uncharacterized protein
MTKATLIENNKNNVDLVLEPKKVGNPLVANDIYDLIQISDYNKLQVNAENIKNAIAEHDSVLKSLQENQQGREIRYQILERIDATIIITIDKDEMEAVAEITAARGGVNLSAKAILDFAKNQGVKKGFCKEDLLSIAQRAANASPGELVKQKIALGIPPRNGNDAQITPLVESAQSRILRPKLRDDGSVDMRDFGDIVCVKIGDPLIKKTPPTLGKQGFTVKGSPLSPAPGNDLELKAGEGTSFSPQDHDLLISTKVGMPRLIENGMEVDEVYQLNNVDISTGNIKFEGCVIIKGDVNEGMKVIASGDVTIGGFVESAIIESGGDITVSGGIIGKKQDVENTAVVDCVMTARLTAKGKLYAKYCQYSDITCGGDIMIENQLMHCMINTDGKVWVGNLEKANGKLIGGFVSAGQSVSAGIVGATAGSHTIVRFNKIVQLFKEQIAEVDVRLKAENIKTEELRAAENKLKKIPKAQRNEHILHKIHNTYIHHSKLLAQIMEEKQDLEQRLQTYMSSVYIEATDKIYQGVELNIGEFVERTKREYGPSKMLYKERKVHIEPIIHS